MTVHRERRRCPGLLLGHTDREWAEREWAERDFSRRIDDYQALFKVEEKEPGQEPGGYYRYYSTQRPFDIGATP